MVYVSHHVCGKRRLDLENDELEALWFEIKVSKCSILVCNLYRPPSSTVVYWSVLRDMLESAASEGKELILLGDFNCNVSGRHPQQTGLADLATEINMSQLIAEPTRVTETSNTTIDLQFSTNASQFVQSGCVHTFVHSDHHMIYGVLKAKVTRSRSVYQEVRCLAKCNVDDLLTDLATAPWSLADSCEDVDDMWECWKQFFFHVLDSHAPKKSVRVRGHNLP